jgi:hypothetical protein
MTIMLDPKTEADLRAIAEQRHLSIEAYLTDMIARDAERLERAGQAVPSAAELVRDGPFVVIAAPLPPGWNPVQAIEEMRAERDRQALEP